MNPTKKTIQSLEGKFDSHEIWTRAEVKQVLNTAWLESATVEEFGN